MNVHFEAKEKCKFAKRIFMSEKKYNHSIYKVGHPTVAMLIAQAIEIRKFKFLFPEFYETLYETRIKVRGQLIDWIKNLLLEKGLYENDQQLADLVATIIFGRRLLDKVIAYITTGDIEYDEYITNELVTKSEYLKKIDSICNEWDKVFRDYFHTTKEDLAGELPNGEKSFSALEAVRQICDYYDFYLPNILVDWRIEDLFVDYLILYINYNIYFDDFVGLNDSINILKNILTKYPLPMVSKSGSFMTHTKSDDDREYVNLHVNINQDVDDFPALLESFVLNFQSKRIDFYKKGILENKINTGYEFNKSISVIDRLVNSLNMNLSKGKFTIRPDSLITPLIALIYVDLIYSRKIMKNSDELESINIRIGQYGRVKNYQNITDMIIGLKEIRNEMLEEEVNISDIRQLLLSILECHQERLEIVVKKKRVINAIFIILKESDYQEKILMRSLEPSIENYMRQVFMDEEEKAKTDQSLDPFGLGDIFTVAISGRSLR